VETAIVPDGPAPVYIAARQAGDLGSPAMEIHPHPEGRELLRVEALELDATFEVYGNCPV
jgi:hypothetical protein